MAHRTPLAELLQDTVMGNGLADHVDGSLTLARIVLYAPRRVKQISAGWRRRSQYQVRSISESLARGSSHAAVRMSTTREVVMV
jgi:hypothetical protein